MTQSVTTILDGLNLVDRFLFDETMENPEAYQAAISILLEDEVEFLKKPETEKELRISPELRSVRLDVISMDKFKRIYYTEMQKTDTRNLMKRSRYYQAQLDCSLLEPGSTDFNKLNDACFILVAPFDLFGKGRYRYTFEGVCRECPEIKINDGAMRIFINTKGNNDEEFSQEFLDFMKYITDTTDELAEQTESKKIKTVHENVKKIRQSEKMGVKYMQLWEEKLMIREAGREEGREEGMRAGMKALIEMCREAGLSKEDTMSKIKEKCELTDQDAEKYLTKYWNA